ncbi:MAG: hypothetical protein OXT69_02600 [Candidatus Poribacteria bacterium]|nr:hypothetical protein [Candidatus Poribacteria bacterium]
MRILLAAVCVAACLMYVGCGDETIVIHTAQETREDDEFLYGMDSERSAEEPTGMEDGGFDADFDSALGLALTALIAAAAAAGARLRRRQIQPAAPALK